MVKVARGTEGGDAPVSQGATSENTGLYLNEEQRREAGCSAGRMQRHFHHGLLDKVPDVLGESLNQGRDLHAFSRSASLEVANGTHAIAAMRHDGILTGGVFAPDGRWLVTTGRDRTARVWALQSPT